MLLEANLYNVTQYNLYYINVLTEVKMFQLIKHVSSCILEYVFPYEVVISSIFMRFRTDLSSSSFLSYIFCFLKQLKEHRASVNTADN